MRKSFVAMAGALLLMGCVGDQATYAGPQASHGQPAYNSVAYVPAGHVQSASADTVPGLQIAQGSGIQIYNADYGERGRTCNAERRIARECSGRRDCEIEVDNRLCGDPMPDVVKELRLSFGCEGRRGSDQESVRAREGQRIRIECERGRAQAQVFGRPGPGPEFGQRPGGRPGRGDRDIQVLDARYGSQRNACNAAQAVARQCDGRDRCGVRVDNNLCGDPAYGEQKVLEVNYSCRGARRNAFGREGQRVELHC